MNHSIQKQIINILSDNLQKIILHAGIDLQALQEIRIRVQKPFIIQENGRERIFQHIVTKEELQKTLDHISNYSMYAYETEMRQGFITIEGGHRVGLSGKILVESDKIKNFQYITSINIRICHEIKGCADKLLPFLIEKKQIVNTLVFSPPGQGKTTILRDLVRQISNGTTFLKGQTVCVVDERSEIGGSYQGIPQNDIGIRTDILDNCPKAEGMLLMIRSMNPRVLAVDEIGTPKDLEAIGQAIRCGVTILATLHANCIEEVWEKLTPFVHARHFKRYVLIGNSESIGLIDRIYDEEGQELCI